MFGLPLLPTALIIYVFLVSLFTHQSLTVSIVDKKGRSALSAGFMGLIPVYGLYWALTLKSNRKLAPTSIPSILNWKNILGTAFIYGELVLLAFVVVTPIIYTIGTSLSPGSGILNTIWPENPTLDNYKFLLMGVEPLKDGTVLKAGTAMTKATEFACIAEETCADLGSALFRPTMRTFFRQWYWNTLQVAFFTMVFAVLFVTGTAYVFARYNFKGKKAGLLTILVLQMFPSFLGLIALFTLFQTFNLTNQPLALVVVYVSGSIPFNIWLIKGYLQNVPKELDESAKIDGANKLQIFFQIILPLSVPIISFVAVTQFMAPWMDYILPSYLIIDEEKWTLAVGIFEFITNQAEINYSAFAAAAIIVAFPITLLYITFQRYLIEGITAGANKG